MTGSLVNYESGRGSSRVGSPRVVVHSKASTTVSSRPAGSVRATSIKRWFVRVIILATTAFAFLDLVLLVTGLRH